MKNHTVKSVIFICSALLFVFAVPLVFAGQPEKNGADAAQTTGEEKIGLDGFKFGVALGLTMDIGENDRVESAEVVNGVVRVTKEDNDTPRIMLETHYFFTPDYELFKHEQGKWGIGPFVGIQSGSKDVVEYIGAGIMLGFRRSTDNTDSFNIGLGVVVDPSVKILGDDIEENQPLPLGETEVRYKETSQLGLLAMVSYGF